MAVDNGVLAFAFAVGAAATVNPCGWALLPAFAARQFGGGDGTIDRALMQSAATALAATAGFLLVFLAVGSALATGAHWLQPLMPWLGLALGIMVSAAGLGRLLGRQLPWRSASCRVAARRAGGFMFGIGYGMASLSCTLPVFLAAVAPATTEGLLASLVALLAYAVGMAAVLLSAVLLAVLVRHGFGGWVSGAMPVIARLGGLVMAAAGAYITAYWAVALFGDPLRGFGNELLLTGEHVSAVLRSWVAGPTAMALAAALVAALLLIGVGARSRGSGAPLDRQGAGHRSSPPGRSADRG